VYEALAKGDVQTVLGLLSEKVEWNEAEHFPYWPGGPFIGPQAVLTGVFARIPNDFDGFTVDVRRLVGGGDTVLAEVRYRGTRRRPARAWTPRSPTSGTCATARLRASSSTPTRGRSRR
jgi:ketosteroid isomerase-like protein